MDYGRMKQKDIPYGHYFLWADWHTKRLQDELRIRNKAKAQKIKAKAQKDKAKAQYKAKAQKRISAKAVNAAKAHKSKAK